MEAALTHVSGTTQPIRYQRAAATIDPQRQPKTFSILTQRGRRLLDVSQDPTGTTEHIKRLHSTFHQRVKEESQCAKHHPDYPEAVFAEQIEFDSVTCAADRMVPSEALNSTYDMEDLTINLAPDQAKYFGGGGGGIDIEFGRCVEKEGCYYRKHFPEVGSPGPVALPSYVTTMVKDILPRAAELGRESLLGTLRELVNASANRHCIICILLRQSAELFCIRSGCTTNGSPHTLLSLPDEALENVERVPPLDPLVRTHDDLGYGVLKPLKVLKNYRLVACPEGWDVQRIAKK